MPIQINILSFAEHLSVLSGPCTKEVCEPLLHIVLLLVQLFLNEKVPVADNETCLRISLINLTVESQ
jgi:hypothetical protein